MLAFDLLRWRELLQSEIEAMSAVEVQEHLLFMLYLWYNIEIEEALRQGLAHIVRRRHPHPIDDLEEEDVNFDGWDCATNVLIQARDDKTRGHNGLAAVIHGRA